VPAYIMKKEIISLHLLVDKIGVIIFSLFICKHIIQMTTRS